MKTVPFLCASLVCLSACVFAGDFADAPAIQPGMSVTDMDGPSTTDMGDSDAAATSDQGSDVESPDADLSQGGPEVVDVTVEVQGRAANSPVFVADLLTITAVARDDTGAEVAGCGFTWTFPGSDDPKHAVVLSRADAGSSINAVAAGPGSTTLTATASCLSGETDGEASIEVQYPPALANAGADFRWWSTGLGDVVTGADGLNQAVQKWYPVGEEMDGNEMGASDKPPIRELTLDANPPEVRVRFDRDADLKFAGGFGPFSEATVFVRLKWLPPMGGEPMPTKETIFSECAGSSPNDQFSLIPNTAPEPMELQFFHQNTAGEQHEVTSDLETSPSSEFTVLGFFMTSQGVELFQDGENLPGANPTSSPGFGFGHFGSRRVCAGNADPQALGALVTDVIIVETSLGAARRQAISAMLNRR